MKITKKWHNKYGARIVNAKYFKHIDINSLFSSVSTNRTHEKSENAANDKESDSISPSP